MQTILIQCIDLCRLHSSYTYTHAYTIWRIFYACKWFLWCHETTRDNENAKLRLKSYNFKINFTFHVLNFFYSYTRTHRQSVAFRKYLQFECWKIAAQGHSRNSLVIVNIWQFVLWHSVRDSPLNGSLANGHGAVIKPKYHCRDR